MADARGGLTVAAADDAPRFADLFAALPVAAIAIDPQGRVAHANAAAELLLNLSERAMFGQRIEALVTLKLGDGAPGNGRGFAAYGVEAVIRGVRQRLDFLATELPDRPGWRLLTLHQAPVAGRIAAPERSAGARAAIGAAAMLAHEIKNPLSGIRGAAQLLRSDLDGEQGELADLITSEVDRVAALIDAMQDFTDTRPLALEPVNIHALLDHARRVALAGFARGIVIEERFDPSLPPVRVNRDAFLQVLLNLLKNAAEAMAEVSAPRIILATAYRHGFSARSAPDKPFRAMPIEVQVIDHGPGAPPEIVDHLFEPFVSGKPEGRGLGLPLVEKLVRAMDGIVQYARGDDPPHTLFRVLLPRGDR